MDWKDRIISEKSLFQVYLKARKVASARLNTWLAWITFIFVAAGLMANAYYGLPIAPFGSLISGVREATNIGFSFTIAILGFLIAGFAIFASITKPDVFILLAKIDHNSSEISELQFIFFNFLLIFIHYILFLSVSIFAKLTLYSGGPLSGAFQLVLEYNRLIIVLGSSLIFAFLAGWLVFLLMLLKSFIWNMYQAVLIAILTEAQMSEQDMRERDSDQSL